MSNTAKLMLALVVLALVVLALAVPAVAGSNADPNLVDPNQNTQTTTMAGDDGEIWLVTYIDLDGSGTFNDRREFLDAVLIRPAQR